MRRSIFQLHISVRILLAILNFVSLNCVLSFARYGRCLLDLYVARGTFVLLWFVGSFR
jgi:hypothetical protein